MKSQLRNCCIGIALFGGFLLAGCSNSQKTNVNNQQDSIYQDSLRKDSLQNQPETPVDELLQEDSLSENNRDLRTP